MKCLRHNSTQFGQCSCGVSGAKGGHSSSEQAQADKLRTQEFQLTQQQLGLQNNVLGGVNSQLQNMINAGGMLPSEQSALTSIALNDIPAQFQGVQGQIANQLTARGISGGQFGAGSGDIARQFGALGAMEAGQQQQALSNIQLQKAQQLRQALGMQLGVAGAYGGNVGTFNSGTVGSLNAGVTAANNADQASTSWMGPVFGALGSIGGGFAGGFGRTMGGGNTPCWIARATYGDTAWQVMTVHNKLFSDAQTNRLIRFTLGMYIAFGEQLAFFVKRSKVLKFGFKRLFDRYIGVENL